MLKALPLLSVTVPPASSIIIFPAAKSQGLNLNSQNPETRPEAT